MKITKVYTRTGDKGETSLVGGVRIKKSDIRLEAYGTVDELSAQLGMLVAMMEEGEERQFIIREQPFQRMYPSGHRPEPNPSLPFGSSGRGRDSADGRTY